MYENGVRLSGYFRKLKHRTQQKKRLARLYNRTTYDILVREHTIRDQQYAKCRKYWGTPIKRHGFAWYQKYWIQGHKWGKWDKAIHKTELRQQRHALIQLEQDLPN